LNPDRFVKLMGAQDKLKRRLNAYQVPRQVIPLVTLQRTQATTIEVNGVSARIGDSIPSYRVCTAELGWGDAVEFEAYKSAFDASLITCTPSPRETKTAS
jgi:hypothetical protein